jgi:hypothetical protein
LQLPILPPHFFFLKKNNIMSVAHTWIVSGLGLVENVPNASRPPSDKAAKLREMISTHVHELPDFFSPYEDDGKRSIDAGALADAVAHAVASFGDANAAVDFHVYIDVTGTLYGCGGNNKKFTSELIDIRAGILARLRPATGEEWTPPEFSDRELAGYDVDCAAEAADRDARERGCDDDDDDDDEAQTKKKGLELHFLVDGKADARKYGYMERVMMAAAAGGGNDDDAVAAAANDADSSEDDSEATDDDSEASEISAGAAAAAATVAGEGGAGLDGAAAGSMWAGCPSLIGLDERINAAHMARQGGIDVKVTETEVDHFVMCLALAPEHHGRIMAVKTDSDFAACAIFAFGLRLVAVAERPRIIADMLEQGVFKVNDDHLGELVIFEAFGRSRGLFKMPGAADGGPAANAANAGGDEQSKRGRACIALALSFFLYQSHQKKSRKLEEIFQSMRGDGGFVAGLMGDPFKFDSSADINAVLYPFGPSAESAALTERWTTHNL